MSIYPKNAHINIWGKEKGYAMKAGRQFSTGRKDEGGSAGER